MASTIPHNFLNTLCFTDEFETSASADPPKDALQALCDLVGISSESVKEEGISTPTKRLKSEPTYSPCYHESSSYDHSFNQLKTPKTENEVCIKYTRYIYKHHRILLYNFKL